MILYSILSGCQGLKVGDVIFEPPGFPAIGAD